MPNLSTDLTAGAVTIANTLDVTGVITAPAGLVGNTAGTHTGSVTGAADIGTVTVTASGAIVGGTFNGYQLTTGTADPTAGGGVAATRPALYMRTGTDQAWIKTGAGDTAWTRILSAADLANTTLTGTTNAAIVLASTTVSAPTLITSAYLQLQQQTTDNATGVGFTFTHNGVNKPISSNGTYVLTSTPHMAIGGAGYVVIFRFTGSGGVTFTDNDSMAGTLFQLGAATRAMVAGSVLVVISDGTYWHELIYKA